MLISHRSMIKISASNKLSGKDMTPILCGDCPKISCIGKTLQRNPSALRKSGSHFRIEKFQNPQAVLCLMLRHLKLISLLSPGNDHQIIRDHLLHCFFCVFAFPMDIRPDNISARKIILYHMSEKDQVSIFYANLTVSHISPPFVAFHSYDTTENKI